MKYSLFRQGEETSAPVLGDDLESDFRATAWARAWLQAHAEQDRYVLKPEDGGQSTLMLRTVAGQWYAMSLVDPAG